MRRLLPHRLLIGQLGRRGTCLLIFGLVFILYGLNQLFIPETGFIDPRNYRKVLYLILPPVGWTVTWCLVGVVCLWQAFTARSDRVAYTAATLLTSVWGFGSLASILLGASAGRAISSFLVWGVLFNALLATISGWPAVEQKLIAQLVDQQARRRPDRKVG